ncbi:unnamed protein product [Schistosoma rodhaini]|uniref:AAA+ ATPase domain-containing protein n=1 Tax=Schistosoma rodhaini TaxID=6188 RepID=A0AA85ER01_9TREM|nr:unnamed protein product [Schistosoma rodhaini]
MRSKTKEWLLKEISNSKIQTNFPKPNGFDIDSCYVNYDDDLAIHKDKLKELRTCIKKALTTKKLIGGPIILLIGPTGSGKTIAVEVLARSVFDKVNVVQFLDEGIGHDEYTEIEKFVLSSGVYGGQSVMSSESEESLECASQITVMILENLPAVVSEHPSRFHNLLRLHSTRACANCLLVLILSSSTFTENDLCERIICPPTLCSELLIQRIEFNPIAPTLIIKALSRIGNIMAKQFGLKLPSRQLLQSIANDCSGDIRSAVNQLHFQLSSDRGNWNNYTLPYSHRDGVLSLFRTIGKILYCKRKPVSNEQIASSLNKKEGELPSHLVTWRRPPLDFDLEILDLCHTDGGHIVSWLHENYPDFSPNMTALELVSQQFSCADAFLTGGMNWQLGLTPASDSFVSRKFKRPYNVASKYYPALTTARTILLADGVEDVSGSDFSRNIKAFRSFRPPSTLNSWKLCKQKLDTLDDIFLTSNSLSPIWLVEHMITSRIDMVLDYLPIMWKVLGEEWFSQFSSYEMITSLCNFSHKVVGHNSSLCTSSNSHHINKYHANNDNNINGNDENIDWYCPLDAVHEGNNYDINENFSDEENIRVA